MLIDQPVQPVPAVLIKDAAAPGRTSGQAIAAMQQVADRHLPTGYGYDWTAMPYQELQSAGQRRLSICIRDRVLIFIHGSAL
jgi:multidrug efflux pump subunit AcrB